MDLPLLQNTADRRGLAQDFAIVELQRRHDPAWVHRKIGFAELFVLAQVNHRALDRDLLFRQIDPDAPRAWCPVGIEEFHGEDSFFLAFARAKAKARGPVGPSGTVRR
jgi:hypothetical protein